MSSSSFKTCPDFKQEFVRLDTMEVGGLSRAPGNDDRFLHDFEAIKEDVKTMEKLQKRLQEYSEDSKNIRDAAMMRELRAIMDSEIDHILILGKGIMRRLEGLERSNAVSSLDRSRTAMVAGVGKKMRDMMDEFQGLRAKMAATYKETVEYKYYLLTGEKQYIEKIENLISTGGNEQMLSDAIQEQGRDRVVDILQEIYERREGAKYLQKNLIDLHQLLLDIVSLIETQGQKMMNHHEHLQMPRNHSFIRPGAAQLHDSWDHEKDAKKRGTIALILVVVLIVILIFPLFQFESNSGKE